MRKKKKNSGGKKTYKAAANIKIGGVLYKAGETIDAELAKSVPDGRINVIYITEQ